MDMLKKILMRAGKALWIMVVLVIAVHLTCALTLDQMLEYREVTYTSPSVPPALDGYTIAFLTDIHGTTYPRLRGMVTELDERGVDLVLLGGDFSGQKDLAQCFAILSEIQAPDGFYGVEGNHDNADKLREAMSGAGMTLLENNGVQVREGLYIGGVEDLWNRNPDVAKATADAGPEDFVVLLAHNPDVSMQRDCSGVDLTLSGHTHGGEVTLFGLWAPAMGFVSRYGQKFRSGWSTSGAGTDVYVSRGIGKSFVIRAFSRPQVILFTLRSSDFSESSHP